MRSINIILLLLVFSGCSSVEKKCFDVALDYKVTCFNAGNFEYCVDGKFIFESKKGDLYMTEGDNGVWPFTTITVTKGQEEAEASLDALPVFLKAPVLENNRYTVLGYSPNPSSEIPIMFIKVLLVKDSDYVISVSSSGLSRLNEVFKQIISSLKEDIPSVN